MATESSGSLAAKNTRSPWRVIGSVWYALFLREAVSRTTADRFAWFWMIFEPIAFVAIMTEVRTFIRGAKLISGADFIPWMIVGLLGFFLFREGMMRGLGAVDANKSLLAYRQVHSVDPVLVRNFTDGVIRSFVLLFFIAGGALLGIDILPDRVPLAAFGWLSLWVLGLGMGLVLSVVGSLVPEVGRLMKMLSLPLLILSGVIFPLQVLPHHIQEIMLYNPIVHGLEHLRLGFFELYKTPDISLIYIWLCALGTCALGLALHVRFASALQAR